jgi:hypothetical protein
VSKEDPDLDDNHCYYSGEAMPPAIAELHGKLTDNVERLEQMLKACVGPLHRPGGYPKGYKFIAVKNEDGERSEFSQRLSTTRALFEALIALEGLEQ